MRDFIQVCDLNRDELNRVLDRADLLQEKWRAGAMPQTLQGKRIGLWFFGSGFRNRVAFELGARSMGADVSFIPGELGVHEPIEDIAHYLDNWFSMLVIRCKNHQDLMRVASDSRIPVINARTTFNHPCEILGDLQYIRRKRGTLQDLKVVFVGETTNLCMSWFEAAKILPIDVVQVGPPAYLPDRSRISLLNQDAVGRVSVSEDLAASVDGDTDVVYTDCWPKTEDAEEIKEVFSPYQITGAIVDRMKEDGFFMPCPPIARGQEVSDDSLERAQYCDYEAKEYLLHAQNAIMEFCMDENAG
jgi:ornithine carbamoyltransferase